MLAFDSQEVNEYAKQLKGWTIAKDSLQKEFVFKDFDEAFGFMVKMAEYAKQINHHPDWSNSYNKVLITLTSHEVRGLTKKDFDFASQADVVASNLA